MRHGHFALYMRSCLICRCEDFARSVAWWCGGKLWNYLKNRFTRKEK